MAAAVIVVVACVYLFVVLPQLQKRRPNSGIAPKGMLSILVGKNAPAVVVGVAIPLLAIALYLAWSGKPGMSASNVPSKAQDAQMAPEHIEMIKALAARLEKNPDDGKGWVMLARTYATLGRFPEAATAYEKAANLIHNDAKLLTDYADVLAVANSRNMQGKPLELIHSALKIDPNNTKALFLIGKASYQAGDFTHAVGYWEKLLQSLPPDSPLAKQVRDNIAQARAQVK
jgi:cytochrome c-type biogenesis protein CcmH